MNIVLSPTTTPSLGAYGCALSLTVVILLLLWRQYRRLLQPLSHSTGAHDHRRQAPMTDSPHKPFSCPELYHPVKAILFLHRGAEAWLPYLIPLYTPYTKLGSDLTALSTAAEIGFELLRSLSIDEEHCMIQAQDDAFMIFDRARFNHTLVDQEPVPPEGRRLATGAIITLGAVEYLFVHNQTR